MEATKIAPARPANGQTRTHGDDLVEVKNVVNYFAVRGGLLQRVVALGSATTIRCNSTMAAFSPPITSLAPLVAR